MGLGFVCFALWNAWQHDYAPQPVVPAAAANTASAIPITSSTVTSSLATAVPASSAPTPVVTTVPAQRLIKVHTDVLDLAIDSLGGNIVSAKLLQYPAELHQPTPVQLLSSDASNFYTTQSGVISNGKDLTSQTECQSAQREYALQPGQKNLVVKLVCNNGGVTVNKIFTFTPKNYAMNLDYEIVNQSGKNWTGQLYTELKRKAPEKSGGFFKISTYSGAAISSAEKPYEKIDFDEMTKTPLNRDIQGGWMAMEQRYFLSAWVPDSTKVHRYFSSATPEQIYGIGMVDNVQLNAGEKTQIKTNLYIGPEIAKNLQALSPNLDRTVDYGWLWFVSIALFWVMQQIYKVVGNWGWAIILVTVLIKLVFYKLSETSFRSMAKMKDLAPKMQALKERYGDDKQKMSQATMEMYRKEKINPLGGCLPIVIQIPVFIALYYVLLYAVELRHAPFILWIHDLSAKDPYYILPLLMGVSMFVQQKMQPASPDPTQAKMMMMLPVVFTVFFLSFPSGLVLYWFINNCLTVLQQWYINKKVASKKAIKN